MAFLDLYRDDAPLLADNFDVMKDDRKWRTSRIDAFGSNVAFVIKKCKSADPKDGKNSDLVRSAKTRAPKCQFTIRPKLFRLIRLGQVRLTFGDVIAPKNHQKIIKKSS